MNADRAVPTHGEMHRYMLLAQMHKQTPLAASPSAEIPSLSFFWLRASRLQAFDA